MVVNFAAINAGRLTRNQLEHSIKRNFGGFDPDDKRFDPMDMFTKQCSLIDTLEESEDGKPETDPIKLVQASLFGTSGR